MADIARQDSPAARASGACALLCGLLAALPVYAECPASAPCQVAREAPSAPLHQQSFHGRYGLVLMGERLRLAAPLAFKWPAGALTPLLQTAGQPRLSCPGHERTCPAEPTTSQAVATFEPSLRMGFTLGRGQELTVNLTPTPRNCAPLVRMTF
jgi:hypothetical protein